MHTGTLYLRLKEIELAISDIRIWDETLNSRYRFCEIDLTSLEREKNLLFLIYKQSRLEQRRYVNGVRKRVNRLYHEIKRVRSDIKRAEQRKIEEIEKSLKKAIMLIKYMRSPATAVSHSTQNVSI